MVHLAFRLRYQLPYALALAGLCTSLPIGMVNPSTAASVLVAQQSTRTPQTVTGRLAETSAVVEDHGSYYEFHAFEGAAGEVLAIELTSEEFDAYLILVGPDGATLAEDDDGAGGTNSSITSTLPTTGIHTIIVTSYGPREVGAYQLMWQTATTIDEQNYQENGSFNDIPYEPFDIAENIAHAEQDLATREQQLGDDHPALVDSLNSLAWQYVLAEDFEKAEDPYLRALAISEQASALYNPELVGNPENLDRLYELVDSLHNLAQLYELMERPEEAESLYLHALTIIEQASDDNRLDIAHSLHDLARLYELMERPEEADNFYLRALAIFEQADTDLLRFNLTRLPSTRYFEEAENLYLRALAIREQALGADHPGLVYSLYTLAQLYASTGNIGEAENLYLRALAIREQALGTDHPDVVDSLHTLAWLYESTLNNEAVENLHLRILAIRERTLGPNHRNVAESLRALALLNELMERPEEAEGLYLRALEIYEQAALDDPAFTDTLGRLDSLYNSMGRYDEAEVFRQRASAIEEQNYQESRQIDAVERERPVDVEEIAIAEQELATFEQQLGPSHPDIVDSLGQLAWMYKETGRYGEAEILYRRALEINEQALGSDHSDTIVSLLNLADFYESLGRYREAEPFYARALEILEQQIESDESEIIYFYSDVLSRLAGVYKSMRRYEEAETFYLRFLEISEQLAYGPDDPNIVYSLDDLAGLYQAMGRYDEAETLYQRALAINEQAHGDDPDSTVYSLNNLAWLYQTMGRYDEAESFYRRALEIRKEQLGSNHIHVANSFSDLASLYQSAGRYDEAESRYRQALALREQELGSDHPRVADSLNNLAWLHQLRGRYDKAEPLYRQTLEIREQALGFNHRRTAASLDNLAYLYWLMGRYDEAEPFYMQALESFEQAVGPDHPETGASLNNLALLYRSTERYGDAETLYQRALSISERAYGSDHLEVATNLNNLAELYWSMGRFDIAMSLAERSLKLREQQLGPNHLDTAASLDTLAAVYRSLDRYQAAEPIYLNILEIREQTFGSDHPATTDTLINLAGLYSAQGQPQAALDTLRRGLNNQEIVFSRNLLGGSDAQKRAYLDTRAWTIDNTVSLHLNSLPTDADAAHLAFTTLLQRKSRVLDLFTNLQAQLADDPEAAALLDELNAVNTQLANLAVNSPSEDFENHQTQAKSLQNQITSLEDQLSRLSADFANVTASPSVAEIQAALPPATTLVEFTRYRPVNPTGPIQQRYGDDHYAAYILQPNGTIQGIDLGPAVTIDTAVETFSQSLASSNTPLGQFKAEAQDLEQLIMAPVRDSLGATTTIFISPDGALNLIPFEALVDEAGDYLLESYQFRYLTSGRDLLRVENTPASNNPAVLVGNPIYGRPGEVVAQADTRAIDFDSRIFPALPGTQAEVDLIAPKLPGAEVYTQTNATEALLKQQSQPSILHIATHGFFEPTEETLNPLLQSGLILAGAAAEGQSGPDQDGILTALEVTGMNLSGTQLVVLSACETGLGELAAGEGVYGLRRAFVLAGSHSQVISLWKVDDIATQELMVDYYDRLISGTPRDASLRETQLAFLNSDEYSHPYYWAAFIGSGDWRAIEMNP
ncbi:MAG: tetratricopeptide repeat protein [Leptolyngbyaceae cyanobacterium]